MRSDRSTLADTSYAQQLVSPLVSVQTYKNMLYFVLAFPLAVIYSFIIGVGTVFGILFSLVLVGIVALVLVILAVRVLMIFERGLTSVLLDIELTAPDDASPRGQHLGTVRGYIHAKSTWRGLGFLSIKFWLGILGVILFAGLFQGLSMVSTLLRRPHDLQFGEVNGEPVIWVVETVPEAGLAAFGGLLLILIVLHLANGFAYATRRMARALLDGQ